ncbi:chromosome partitioning protein ParB [Vibrio sp. 10N.286.49.C2]|uniref:ParB/Srx family N-terminal domain-containing protein n=1 Tax=unclassified Vibrio TaxID=2614977 RepID=UPI000CBDF484|nr:MULTISPECIES: ParB/Srx family N-terminal domain-containing protein [unclassified Vibrio]PMH25418.1 chromosome partitioning protein ParB [Vibrio sp. 10N.286.49.C2]PMH51274.1 chromosome partitioning protein ParB [Vibrio sp. 10N.286.49.B1]PMH81562.1 chromosome partitioning protein ParB [Vibrio sp. 10N.286.48.B7]
MSIYFMRALMTFTLFAIPAVHAETISKDGQQNALQEGHVIQVSLSELLPTQPAIGYDQVFYKLGRFDQDKKKLFDEICETNGQDGLKNYDDRSTVNDANSFECKDQIGSHKKDMKTIAIAPNGSYYLTDGHHTFNVLWDMPEGGENFKVYVVIDKDYRGLTSMSVFWDEMVKDGNTWLNDSAGYAIEPQQLPSSLGMNNFENDQYRALMYFSRDIAWNKPKLPVPFLEFYWTKEIRNNVDLSEFDLTTKSGYSRAITQVSHAILAVRTDDVGGSGKTPTQMGQFTSFSQKALDKTLRAGKGKVSYMLNYKNAF